MKQIILFLVSCLCFASMAQAQAEDFIIENGEIVDYIGTGGDIVIPDGATSIDPNAFGSDNGQLITSITLPNSMTDIRGDFFMFVYHLTNIYVLENNTNYSSIDGILYDKNQTTLVCYPPAKMGLSFTIPGTVKTIGYGAFFECENLISIDMSSVEILENLSVYNCVNLSMVKIPNTVTRIGNSSFSKCNLLRDVMVSWQDPSTVTYGERLFASSETTIFNNAILHIPAGTTSAYQTAVPWSSFATTLEDNITNINEIQNQQPVIYTTNCHIVVNNTFEPISIFDITGHLIASGTKTEYSVPNAGFYIVQAGNITKKVIVK